MADTYDTKASVEQHFGSTRHVRGTVLRARYVGWMPAWVEKGITLAPAYGVYDFLIRTKSGRYMVVRGQHADHGQPFGGSTMSHRVEDWWTESRRKDAEETFEKLAKLAEPVSTARGGGALWDGQFHTAVEFNAAIDAGTVNNREKQRVA